MRSPASLALHVAVIVSSSSSTAMRASTPSAVVIRRSRSRISPASPLSSGADA